jgi:hypothetical protein
MLAKRRRDWFPIVATDLFCGVLAAVIIFDAVSPREVSSAGKIAYMEITFPDKAGVGVDYADRCRDIGRVVFSFKNDSKPVNTLIGGRTDGNQANDVCRLQALFTEIHFDRELENPSVIVAEYPGDLGRLEVTVAVPGQDTIVCRQNSPKCPLR